MKKINIFWLIMGVAFVFVISEMLYTFQNRELLSDYAFRAAKILAVNKNAKGSFSTLWKTGLYLGKDYFRSNTWVDANALSSTKLPDSSKFKQEYLEYMQNLPGNALDRAGNYDMGRLFYDLSILAFYSDRGDITPLFLTLAVGFNPKLSFWYLELANYHLATGQYEKAKVLVDKCISIPESRNHCVEYSENNLQTGTHEYIGFESESVTKYFESGLR